MLPPKVSVICIFYNAERFIEDALESVFGQDITDFELILVDDGSTDSSTATARRAASTFPGKVTYVEHEDHANVGMSASRNLGIQNAGGRYIAFIDSDDRWRAPKLREQVGILDARPDVAMVCGTVNYWRSWAGGADKLIPTAAALDSAREPPTGLLSIYPLGTADAPCPSDIMVRREVIDAVGGFENQFRGLYEDIAFFAKIFAQWPVWFSSSVWLDYRLHAESSVAKAVRDGSYGRVRRCFLDWLDGYIQRLDIPTEEEVVKSIHRARWELDHPLFGRILRRIRRLRSPPLRLPS